MESVKIKDLRVTDVEVWSRGLSAKQLVRLAAAAVNGCWAKGKILFDENGKRLKDIPTAEYREESDNCNVHAHIHGMQIHCGSETYFKELGFGTPSILSISRELREKESQASFFTAINGYAVGRIVLGEIK